MLAEVVVLRVLQLPQPWSSLQKLHAVLENDGVSGLLASLSSLYRWGRRGTSGHIYPGCHTGAQAGLKPRPARSYPGHGVLVAMSEC